MLGVFCGQKKRRSITRRNEENHAGKSEQIRQILSNSLWIVYLTAGVYIDSWECPESQSLTWGNFFVHYRHFRGKTGMLRDNSGENLVNIRTKISECYPEKIGTNRRNVQDTPGNVPWQFLEHVGQFFGHVREGSRINP